MKLPLGFLAAILLSRAAAADFTPQAPAQPVIPAHAFNLKDFGGKGDGKTLNTDALHRAVAAVNAAGGGTLALSAGTYLTGPFELCSSMNFRLEAGATVQFIDTFSAYGDSGRHGRYRAMLQIDRAHDVLISGAGTINGHGEAWWPEARRFKADARAHHASSDTSPRPTMVSFSHSQRIGIQGITLTNSPVFNIVQNGCSDVTVDGITIVNPANSPNTDGIDPKDCQRVLIRNCTVDTGDDCVALGGSGGQTETDVLITDCQFLHGHGCSIGSGTHSGVNHVLVQRCTFQGTVSGVRLKSSRGRGGVVEDIIYEDLKMDGVGTPISITSNYELTSSDKIAAALKPAPLTGSTPVWRKIIVRNVTATGAKIAGIISGLPESPASAILLEKVRITAESGMRIAFAEGVTLRDVHVTTTQGPDLVVEPTAVQVTRTP